MKKNRWWRWLLLLLIIIVLVVAFSLIKSKLGLVAEGLTPPKLPEIAAITGKVDKQKFLANEQNWQLTTAERYHHTSQGTQTLPVPYEWFINLPQPQQRKVLFSGWSSGEGKKFSDYTYLERFGFITNRAKCTEDDTKQSWHICYGKKAGSTFVERSKYNPDGLPIGFAKTPVQNIPGVKGKETAIGFTCAACHTGQLVHNNTQYVIEGGAATTDLGQLTKAISATLGQLAISAKYPILGNGTRFDRFARDVLGAEYSQATKKQLSADLIGVIEYGLKNVDIIHVTEGFSRLDALNRIGNQVFHKEISRLENYAPIDAPVNYPHIWTSSWFDWVQYDGSIMQPLVRNAGEALGVNVELDVSSPTDEGRFSSSIPLKDLIWIEYILSGKRSESEEEESGKESKSLEELIKTVPDLENMNNDPDKYNVAAENRGLLSPKWSDAAGLDSINTDLAQKGEELYEDYCQKCHLPPLKPEETLAKTDYKPIEWFATPSTKQEAENLECRDILIGGEQHKQCKYFTEDKVLHLKIIPQTVIGTDPAQKNVLEQRHVNTAGIDNVPSNETTPGVGLKSELCTQAPVRDSEGKETGEYELVTIPFSDGGSELFALALGSMVSQTIDAWYQNNAFEKQETLEESRPNCLQVTSGYRARPLNGVWATAPFLHNGSIATLRDLLKPASERPRYVVLGNVAFDSENVGLDQTNVRSKENQTVLEKRLEKGQNYTKDGLFILDTSLSGNSNQGHDFSGKQGAYANGVIGPKLDKPLKDPKLEGYTELDAIIEYVKTL